MTTAPNAPEPALIAESVAKVALEIGCELLVEALVWQVTMGHTTVTPPLSVQRTLNGIRAHAGEPLWPLRDDPETRLPIDADPYEGQDFDYGMPDPGPDGSDD